MNKDYIPELWTVKKDYIYAAIEAVRNGLEYTITELVTHDLDLGRTTKKNRMWAETMEKDIKQMEQTLEDLKERCPEPRIQLGSRMPILCLKK